MKISIRSAHFIALSLITLTFGCAPAATTTSANDRSVITAADLEQHPGEPIEYAIQRKVSGVTVSKTQDGNLLLQIRGATSVEGKGDPKPPLYVLNGMTLAPTADGALPPLNRNDIETIRVLKGADAGLYGIEGANGVIVITTKRGSGK